MTDLAVGDERVVDIGPIAHGGHFIAHSDGRTLFVRHAVTGERVRVVVTDVNRRIVRADAVEVLEPSADRVQPPCRWAGQCGGCDFQHITLPRQRGLKTQVLRESLVRFGHLTPDDPVLGVEVQPLDDDGTGLHWRTRMTWAQGPDGTWGLRRHHSHDVVSVDECLLAVPGVQTPQPPQRERVVRQVRDRSWRISSDGFWQVHPALPEALVSAVLELGRPRPGETWQDLYSGVGLFSAFLAEAVGPTGSVAAVESDERAVRDARRALHDLPVVRLHNADVGAWLGASDGAVDGVVLDPPRAGAGARVLEAIAARGPRAVVYVGCDPVALSRDIAQLGDAGFRLDAIRAFDAFPMTHHLEIVARFSRWIDRAEPTPVVGVS